MAAWLSLAAAVRLGSNRFVREHAAGCNIGWSLRTLHVARAVWWASLSLVRLVDGSVEALTGEVNNAA
jgi:hypothetical protein